MTPDRVSFLRSQAQLLERWSQPPAGVTDVVRRLVGIQSQEPPAARLAIRPRIAGVTAADVEYERVQARSIVRTWSMRGTLHLVAAEDLDWLLPLFGDVFSAASRRRRAALGLDDEISIRGARALRDAVAAHGPLTRAEIVDHLARRGITLTGQARPYLIQYAALQGFVCCGPDRDGEPTYVLLDDWVPHYEPVKREVALAELARRYLIGYGPASREDLAAWSGLPLRDVNLASSSIASELIELEAGDTPLWLPQARANQLEAPKRDQPFLRLLPRFDSLLLGYRNRRWVVAAEHESRVHPGGGVIHPVVLIDGRVAGVWGLQRSRQRLVVAVEAFDALDSSLHSILESEAMDIARFLNAEAGGSLTVRSASRPSESDR